MRYFKLLRLWSFVMQQGIANVRTDMGSEKIRSQGWLQNVGIKQAEVSNSH